MFADDTNIFISGKEISLLKEEAEKIIDSFVKWFIANRLTLSIEKTSFSVFHQLRRSIPQGCETIQIGNDTISRVDKVKYLGVILDDTNTMESPY